MAEILTLTIVLPDGRGEALARRDWIVTVLGEHAGLRLAMTSGGTDVYLVDASLVPEDSFPLLGMIQAFKASPGTDNTAAAGMSDEELRAALGPVHERDEPGCGYPADSDVIAGDEEEDDPETATCAVCFQVITRRRCAAGGTHWVIPGAAWPGRCGKVPGTPHRPGAIPAG